MCDPATAMMAVSTGVSLIGQSQAASAQEKANENAKAIGLRQWAQSIAEVNTQQQQAQEQAQQQEFQFSLENARVQAETAVTQGEQGVGGRQAGTTLSQIEMENQLRTDTVRRQAEYAKSQAGYERKAAALRYESGQANLPLVQKPDFLSAGLQIGGSYFQGQAKQETKK